MTPPRANCPGTPEYCSENERIAALVKDVASLKEEMTKNTEITQQVRDLIGSFKTLLRLAKTVTVFASMVAAVGAAISKMKGGT